MQVFKDGSGKSYVAVDKSLTRAEALTEGNKFFKIKKEKLKVFGGFLQKNTLFFGKKERNVWVICRK